MKRSFVILLLIPLLFSCNKNKIERLELRNDSLMNQAALKDESINEFLRAFNEIQDNLDSIKAKEMIITERTEGRTELKKEVKQQIQDDINSIYGLLLQNKEKLASLKHQLGQSNLKIAELERMVEHLTLQLAEKDTQIEAMNEELAKLNIQVTQLTRDVDELTQEGIAKSTKIDAQQQEIEQKTEELNTAYFVVGTKKELIDNNVITKEGGFIGIGSTKVMKQDFNQDYFKKIDITQTKRIACPGKKIRIVTTHPPESYSITGSGDNQAIEISDYKAFWKSSKYLVIIID
ncbi:MAG: hypothetical protein JW861_09860 [Bacteroidales bacterium]|nr:hypothetical protein [Bacteroidales bacterium]